MAAQEPAVRAGALEDGLPAVPFSVLLLEPEPAQASASTFEFGGSVLRKAVHLAERAGFLLPVPGDQLLAALQPDLQRVPSRDPPGLHVPRVHDRRHHPRWPRPRSSVEIFAASDARTRQIDAHRDLHGRRLGRRLDRLDRYDQQLDADRRAGLELLASSPRVGPLERIEDVDDLVDLVDRSALGLEPRQPALEARGKLPRALSAARHPRPDLDPVAVGMPHQTTDLAGVTLDPVLYRSRCHARGRGDADVDLERYATNAWFVADLGQPVVELLAPAGRAGPDPRPAATACSRSGSRSLGCEVVGADASPAPDRARAGSASTPG